MMIGVYIAMITRADCTLHVQDLFILLHIHYSTCIEYTETGYKKV